MNIEIFTENSGGIVKHAVPKNTTNTYFTLSAEAGTALKAVFMGAAPALSVNIVEAVDYDIHKALNGGYLVAAFGYAPVKITMSGVDIYASIQNCGKYTDDIKSWWDKYNLQQNPAARVHLSLYGRGQTSTFSCIVTNITRSAEGNTNGVGSYQITLLGARK